LSLKQKMMEIILTDRFNSLVKKLGRTYRRIADDVDGLVDDLEDGRTPGDRLQDVGGAEVYKVRLRNTSARLSKRDGFRVVYHVGETAITLLVICQKPRCADVQPVRIRHLMNELNLT